MMGVLRPKSFAAGLKHECATGKRPLRQTWQKLKVVGAIAVPIPSGTQALVPARELRQRTIINPRKRLAALSFRICDYHFGLLLSCPDLQLFKPFIMSA
jgi:hypothetical protein